MRNAGGVAAVRSLVLVFAMCLPLSATAARLCSYYNYELEPEQVVPPTQSAMWAGSEAFLCDDGSFSGYLQWVGSETVTAIHMHGPAMSDETGDLLYDFVLPVGDRLEISIETFPVQWIPWLTVDEIYIDIHSVEHPDGAIRGVIHPEIAVAESAWASVKRLFR